LGWARGWRARKACLSSYILYIDKSFILPPLIVLMAGNFILLEDRVAYDFGTLSRIRGEPDASGTGMVLYKDIPNLPPEPEVHDREPDQERWSERLGSIHIPKINRTIAFHLNYNIEKASEPAEESLGGPYLVAE
jgi:hypothetical protein